MEVEVFGHELYHSILEVQVVVDTWLENHSTRRSHRSLGGMTPAAYAKMVRTQGRDECSGGGG